MSNHLYEILRAIKKDFFEKFPIQFFSNCILCDDFTIGVDNGRGFKCSYNNEEFEQTLKKDLNRFKYNLEIIRKNYIHLYNKDEIFGSELFRYQSFFKKDEDRIKKIINILTSIAIEDIQIHSIWFAKNTEEFQINIYTGGLLEKHIRIFPCNRIMTILISKNSILLENDNDTSGFLFKKEFYIRNCYTIEGIHDTISALRKADLKDIDDYIELIKMEIY